MKRIMYLYENFLDEKERNKLIVDSMITDKSLYSLPPKSNMGKEIKRVVKEVNENNHWYFDIDRIEYINIFKIDNDTDNRDIHHEYWNNMVRYYGDEPKPIGIHQKEKKLVCICKLNDNSENTSGGNCELINLDGMEAKVDMLPGDMVVFPAFIPFRITPLINRSYRVHKYIEGLDLDLYNERVIYLEAVIRGLSFR
tara:strand:- start:16974 stop:17564 length:591 start_codon:yes stop_codon:yes gene_type:complete